jgi:ferredoxin/flavodoxin---NADP+ reductase
MSDSHVFDTVIIGGGPTGLFGLFYACLRDMDTMLIDSLPELGGQLNALYPEKDVYDMPGFPRIRAKELSDQMVEQAMMHKQQTIVLGERVDLLERDDATNVIQLVTDKGRKIRARTVVITTGAGAFRPNKLGVPALDSLEGRFVHYFVKDKTIFAGKHVVVVGGGDSALDWVINLHDIATDIKLVHRRDAFRAHEDTIAKMKNLPKAHQYLFYEVKDVGLGAEGELEQVVIENNKTNERLMLNAQAIIVNLGFVADLGPVKTWGLELKGHSIVVNSRMETNISGVYAAGDVATFPGKLKLIATGVGEAAIAVNAAKHHIDPTQREQPVHSTSLFEKKKAPAA